jgi:hypothetical protein
MNVCGSTRPGLRTPVLVLLLTASGSGSVVLGFSTAKDDTLAETLVITLLLALFSGGLARSLFLKFARYAAGTCGVLLCIMTACFETIEVLLGAGNFALRLF